MKNNRSKSFWMWFGIVLLVVVSVIMIYYIAKVGLALTQVMKEQKQKVEQIKENDLLTIPSDAKFRSTLEGSVSVAWNESSENADYYISCGEKKCLVLVTRTGEINKDRFFEEVKSEVLQITTSKTYDLLAEVEFDDVVYAQEGQDILPRSGDYRAESQGAVIHIGLNEEAYVDNVMLSSK